MAVGGIQSSSVNGNASAHATTNTMSNAIRILNQLIASDTGRPASKRAVDCAAGRTTGTKNGNASTGNNNSDSRVFAVIALNSVPMLTRPMAASTAIAMSGPRTRVSGRL